MNRKMKKENIAKLLIGMVLAAVVAFFGNADGRAYAAVTAPSGTVTNLKQTAAAADSVDIQFSALLNADVQYEIRVSTEQNGGYAPLATTAGSFASISGLSAGSTYYVKVVPFCVDDSGTSPVNVYGTESAVLSVVTTPASAPASISQTGSGANYVTITWSAVSGANGYFVDYCLSDSATSEKVRVTSGGTSANLYGVVESKNYTAYVTPYRVSSAGFVAYDSSLVTSKSNLSIGTVNFGAPQGTVSGFSQIAATADSAQITFTTLNNAAVSYSVQVSLNAGSGYTECAVVKEGSYTFSELKAATSYYVRVVPFYQNWNSLNEVYDRVYGTASDVFEIVTAPNTKPKSITQTAATKTGLSVQWDAVVGASGYYVDYYCAGSNKQTTKNVSKNSIKLTKLTANKEYHIYVTPYKKSASGFVACDETNYTCKYNIPVLPSKAEKPTVEKYWKSLGKVNLSTKKIACADGYQYQLYTAYQEKDTKITSASSTSYSSAVIKNAKLKNSSVFKVRVRAYITVADKKVYGDWSDWTYTSAPQKVTLSKNGQNIKASWSKVKGADRYAVYISKDKESGYKKCFVTTKTSCDISSFGKRKLKKNTKYYVYVIPQVKVSDTYVSTGKRDTVAEIKY